MMRLWMLGIVALITTGSAQASDYVVETGLLCSGSCQLRDEVSAGFKKYYCLAKDSCGKSYIPECGNTCFDHAVDEAIALCKEQSNDASSCEVITARNGASCDTDREVLVRKAARK